MIALIIFLFIAGIVFMFSSDWDKREIFIGSSILIAFSSFMIYVFFNMLDNDFDINKITTQKVDKKDLITIIKQKENIYATNNKDVVLEIIKNTKDGNLLGYTLVYQKLSFLENNPSIVSGVEFEKEIFIKADPQKFANLKTLQKHILLMANNMCDKFGLEAKRLKNKGNPFYAIFIPFFIFGFWYLGKSTKLPPISISANQQRYFDEVNQKMVYDFYENRKKVKKDRIEIDVNAEEKKLIKTFYNNELGNESASFISTLFFLNLKNLQPTKINSIDEIKSPVYKAIFDKIKKYVEDMELTLDYNRELENNGNFVEFFLMDLWERYTKRINISVANLEILAQNELELEFIGAMDTISINSVKSKGASLYYRYMHFKDRIKDYVNETSENEKTEQEQAEKIANAS